MKLTFIQRHAYGMGAGLAACIWPFFFKRAEYDTLTANPLPFIERDETEGRPRREFIDFKTTKYEDK